MKVSSVKKAIVSNKRGAIITGAALICGTVAGVLYWGVPRALQQ